MSLINENLRNKYKQWQYYVIIGIVSLITIFFFPFIGTGLAATLVLPTTFMGWATWLFCKFSVAIINILLFHCFMQQAKINVKDNPRYLEANEILHRYSMLDAHTYLSPEQWTKKQYSGKGIAVFITSALSAITLTTAILSFEIMTMLTYLFTIVGGIIFGILQMNIAEDYWTCDYWHYAKNIEQQQQQQQTEVINNE